MFIFRTLRLTLFGRGTVTHVPGRRLRRGRICPLRPLPGALPCPARHHGGRTQAGSDHFLRQDADFGLEGGRGGHAAGRAERGHDGLRSSHVTQHQICSHRGRPSKVRRVRGGADEVRIIYTQKLYLRYW